MPIYEYYCGHCKHHFEVLQKVSEQRVPVCEHCRSDALVERWVSAAGFQLKGTGWYATDFKQSQAPVPNQTENTSTTEGVKTEAKTETKTNTQTETSNK